jgi:hypothetical protein
MEVEGRDDALVARDRCLEAIVGAGDFETAQALWRAASRYNARSKQERTTGDYGRPLLPRAHGMQGGCAQAEMDW